MNRIAWFALLVLGCSAAGVEPIAPSPADGDACAVMCSRYRTLRCPEGKPTPLGAPCEEYCQGAADAGVPIAGPTECTSAAQSCAAVDACG